MTWELTTQAEDDIVEINRYLQQGGSENAFNFLNRLYDLFDNLETFPELGRERNDIEKGVRFFPVKKYNIYYKLENDIALIIRVLHTSRDANDFI